MKKMMGEVKDVVEYMQDDESLEAIESLEDLVMYMDKQEERYL